MPDIAAVGQGQVGPMNRLNTAVQEDSAPPRHGRGGEARSSVDRVEVSPHARYMDALRQMPATRDDLVESTGSSIAEGSYLTQEKLSIAIDRLLEDLS